MNRLDDHFHNPRNAGVLEDADLRVEVDNPVCGDVLRLALRRGVDGRIEEARFQVFGCPAAVAAGSALTELLRGRSRGELEGVDRDSIASVLGGLPDDMAHAAVLAADAVERVRSEW